MQTNNKPYTIYYTGELRKLHDPSRAYAWYSNYRLNLLTGEKAKSSCRDFMGWLDLVKLSENKKKIVIHLTYDFGRAYVDEKHSFDGGTLLGIEIEYQKEDPHVPQESGKIGLSCEQGPTLEEYERAFDLGREKLLDGECYQFNLTFPFKFSFKGRKAEDFIDRIFGNKKAISAYAHSTYLPSMGALLLSNSPECLFQLKKQGDHFLCWTMPIKGSMELKEGSSLNERWNMLKNSKKDQAELFMICDMLRNDLCRIEKPDARVVKKKSPLVVPGIIHQYSLIKARLSSRVVLGNILRNMFPGGSITGAPKKRVMEILNDLENYKRGFYTGSTIILNGNIMAGSINIRTADVDFNQGKLTYGAGGGITLLSEKSAEYEEMKLKVNSFLNLL